MKCPVCGSIATSGKSLSSGELVHHGCFQTLADVYKRSEQALSSQQENLKLLRGKLANARTPLGMVVRFFAGGKESEVLKSQVRVAEQGFADAESAFNAAKNRAAYTFSLLIDYPPDWSQRSIEVRSRDGQCTKCRSASGLQVHHIQPLSRGGTNHLNNLTLLCDRCHQRAHGGRDFSISKSVSGAQLAFADRVQLINAAIASGSDVEFLYQKPSESSYNKRKITPQALVGWDHKYNDGQTLCLQGHCHLRDAERNFALKRMTGLKLAKG